MSGLDKFTELIETDQFFQNNFVEVQNEETTGSDGF